MFLSPAHVNMRKQMYLIFLAVTTFYLWYLSHPYSFVLPVRSSVLAIDKNFCWLINLSPSSKMKIFKDIFTGDEMFSDSYKLKLVDNVMYEVYGRLVTRKQGDVKIDGFNPSAEEADEGTDENVESGVDVVLNHRLAETYAFGDKKSYTAYLKDYMKKLVEKLNESSPDQVDTFKNNMNKVMKELLGRFKDLQFFTGESMDIDGMIALLEYRDIDGDNVPVLMFFKHGLLEEKF